MHLLHMLTHPLVYKAMVFLFKLISLGIFDLFLKDVFLPHLRPIQYLNNVVQEIA